MDRSQSKLGLRAALGVLAVVGALAAFWVTSAFAADNSGASDRSSSDSPAAAFVQNDDDGGAPRDGNCPDREGDSEQSSDA